MQLQFRSNNTDGPGATRSAVKPEVPRDRSVHSVLRPMEIDDRPGRRAVTHGLSGIPSSPATRRARLRQ